MSYQAPYRAKPIRYHPMMSARDGNTCVTAISPSMGKKNLQQQNSPIMRPSGLLQRSQQQIKSPATTSAIQKKHRTNVEARVEYNPVHLLSNYPIDSSHEPNSTSAHQQQKKRAISNSLEEAWSTDQLPSGTK